MLPHASYRLGGDPAEAGALHLERARMVHRRKAAVQSDLMSVPSDGVDDAAHGPRLWAIAEIAPAERCDGWRPAQHEPRRCDARLAVGFEDASHARPHGVR